MKPLKINLGLDEINLQIVTKRADELPNRLQVIRLDGVPQLSAAFLHRGGLAHRRGNLREI